MDCLKDYLRPYALRGAAQALLLSLSCGGLVGLTAQQALASQNVCVTCDVPATVYECVLPSIPTDTTSATGNRFVKTGAKLLCMQEIAARYGHRTCSVRKRAVGPCTGQIVVLGDDQPEADQASTTAEQTKPGATSPATGARRAREPGTPLPGRDVARRDEATGVQPVPAAPKPEPKKPEPPKTVAELAKRTAEATNRQFEKTGETISETGRAVGDAVQKSWQCVTSLFSKC